MSKRQDFSRERAAEHGDKIRLGDYTLGQTLGEGEFGKVKIGWKKASGNQVAVKIIRREKLDTAGRLAKVHREISILKQLNHANIVSLHEMIETRNTIGMVLEYASGGELFDYILQQRYLKDDKARRLFAQLVSGVGYLHRNGIIHRDLKLENLLLDSNKNIIITDFGFANTFDPTGESNLENGANVVNLKRHRLSQNEDLARPSEKGYKHSDLMSTSCGSPCYAAPELVVSDGMYSGRKVDVWSCGVILYAMLAGYLPFDDDPDNPEGDNINLLYKYICATPLIFPDYVTPHARDILKRILVPDPMRRADLFEVARHSWLSEYADLVEGITSNVKLSKEEYQRTKALQIPIYEFSHPRGKIDPLNLSRANSERFTYKPRQTSQNLEKLQPEPQVVEQKQEQRTPESPRDQKRRTVQVEYVPPRRHQREDALVEAPRETSEALRETSPNLTTKPPPEPRITNGDGAVMPPTKDLPPPSMNANKTRQRVPRSTSDPPNQKRMTPQNLANDQFRPGSVPERDPRFSYNKEDMRPVSQRLPPSRGSYGLPSSAEVQKTSAQGQISGPTSSLSADPSKERTPSGHLIMPPSVEGPNQPQKQGRGHKRSSTLSGISDRLLNRASSISRKGTKPQPPPVAPPKPDRSHPPTSMRPEFDSMSSNPRKSTDSGRRSLGFGRYSLPGKHKRFNEAYEGKNGSSSASRRVMDLFRRRR